MEQTGVDCESTTNRCPRTLIIKLSGDYEDDILVIHADLPDNDPLAREASIVVNGYLVFGHLTEVQAKAYLQLVDSSDPFATIGSPLT